jgi:transcriptional regulator GlxA family with amidase domain
MPRDRRVLLVIEWMLQAEEPETLRSLAKRAGLSQSRFWHLFREETGLSPADCHKWVRLSRSLPLLEDTNDSMKEVSAAVGFKHQSHYTRSFRERFGSTPVQYRLAARTYGRKSARHGLRQQDCARVQYLRIKQPC